MADAEDTKDLLLETNDEFRQLAAKHHELEDRLDELSSKPYLSDEEQLNEVTLKKQKLHLKDRMEDMLRQYRGGVSGAAMPA
ncbi:MAG: YdcH family protein [Vicinamibacterales bacterium]|nr:YdcH family protein [Vicinamibacterales bacterium]